jgi:glycosyltransferase involved in cell wall biosynthesis
MKTYLVLVPVYNEENNILRFLYNLINFIDFKTDRVLLIDDDSKDNTKSILNKFLKDLDEFKLSFKNKIDIIFNSKNLGYGSNILKGMEYFINSNIDFLITIDCDFQHLVSYINIFKSLSYKYNFITGSRYSINSFRLSEINFFRYLVNKKMLEFLKFYFKDSKYKVTDFFCGFRLYSKDIIKKIFYNLKNKEIELRGFSYEFPIFLWIELLKLRELKLKEVPIPYIFFYQRNFKGSKSIELKDHYQRVIKYISIFVKEINKNYEHIL